MLNEIITLNFVSCAGSLRNLAEVLQHFISIRLPCDARNQNLLLRPAHAKQQGQPCSNRLHLVKYMS